MATCDTCGVEVLMPGRCVSCCVTALDSYESIKEKNAELVKNQSALLAQHAKDTNENGTLLLENAKLTDTINKLMALLSPGEYPSCQPIDNLKAHHAWETKSALYSKACKLTGRVE